MNQVNKVRVPQTSKGVRPTFFDDPANDRIVSMLMALITEVSVMRDRLDTVEAIAEKKGIILAKEIETFEPDPARAEERERRRQEFVDRVFYVFQEEAEDLARGDTPEAYEAAVKISAEG
ncbi:MAG: hypothetical protein SFV19_13745 [Rhodospirillaceae bacterium]|nr:hypothetical protein [Rhodospirillaceae bacterium]